MGIRKNKLFSISSGHSKIYVKSLVNEFKMVLLQGISLFMLLSVPCLAQEQQPESNFFSYPLDGPLHRTAPYISLKPGSVQELLNMVRPAPGTSGWKTRSGTTEHNTTAISANEIESLHTYYDKDSNTPYLFAQCNDNVYQATNYPPTNGTTFGDSIYSLSSGVGKVFSATVGNDKIFAQSGDYPWIYAGTTYPDAVYIDRNTSGAYFQNAWEETRNDDTTDYVDFISAVTDYVYIISHRRLDTITLNFVSGATNANTATADVETRQSGSWVSVTSLSDGTQTGGNTAFGQSGSLTWTYSNNDEAYILPNTNLHGFVYRISSDSTLSSDMQLYQVLVAGDAQKLTPLWDGIWIPCSAAFISGTTSYEDVTIDVTDGSEYSYALMDGKDTMYVAFPLPVTAIYLQPVSDLNNTAVTNTMTFKYWKPIDDAFTTVGTIDDSTSQNSYSIARSGVVQFDAENLVSEGPRNFAGNPIQLYYYEISWDSAFVDDETGDEVGIWEVAGAYAPKTILKKYDGVAEYNGRAVFFPGEFYENGFDYSSEGKGYILRGSDAGSTGGIFGTGEVNAFIQFYSYGILSTKNPPGLFVWEGKIPSKFDELRLTTDKGVVAPHTLLVIEDAVKLFSADRSVHAAIFLSRDGVYMTDGQTIRLSSLEISDYWDTNSAPYIEPSYADISYAWIDYNERTVHIAVPINTTGSGTQTTCNYEIVYNYLTGEWYDRHIRTPAMAAGISLIGSDNGRYAYTGDYAGKVYRTGYGTDDSGSAINSYLITSDIFPYNSPSLAARYRRLFVKAKSQTSGNIDVYLYPDGKTSVLSPSGVTTISMIHSGYDYISGNGSAINLQGTEAESMAFKFEAGSSAIEPMEIHSFTVETQPIREGYE